MKQEWDERQKQELAQIGEKSFLAMFFLCGAGILGQMFFCKGDLSQIAGETVVLLGGGLTYLGLGVRKGLWKKEGSGKRPWLADLAGSVVCGGCFSLLYWGILQGRSENAQAAARAAGLFFIGITLAGFLTLTFLGRQAARSRKRQERKYLEEEEREEEEDLELVFTALTTLDADMVVQAFQDNRIPSVKQGTPENFMTLYAGSPRCVEHIYVSRENKEKALQILSQMGKLE